MFLHRKDCLGKFLPFQVSSVLIKSLYVKAHFLHYLYLSLCYALKKEGRMDLIYIGIIAGFFGLTWLLVRLAEKVK